MLFPNSHVIQLDIDNDRRAISMNEIKNSLSQTRYCFYKIIFPSMQERRHRDSGSLEFESRMCNLRPST